MTGSRGPRLQLNPYLHVQADHLYDPLTDTAAAPGEPGFAELVALYRHPESLATLSTATAELLAARGWLIEPAVDLSRRFYLKYVTLEAHTVCNQSCTFCPVPANRREPSFMPWPLYEQITAQLAAYRTTIDGVSIINYNEPTVDRRFIDQVELLIRHQLPPAVLTNGTGLTPRRVDQLMALGGIRYLCINLSTLDPERYRQERGANHLPLVLRHLDYLKDLELAPLMEIAVLGTGDQDHRRAFSEIGERFAGSRLTPRYYEIMDRAGAVPFGLRPTGSRLQLCGCEQTGSRPLQWLHITPDGTCVLCCQDYHGRYVVGDLTRESVDEVLRGERLARYRRWTYGVEQAPDDFICRRCIFARTREHTAFGTQAEADRQGQP